MKYVPSAQELLAEWPRLLLIGCILLSVSFAFAWASGWLTPTVLSPGHFVDAFERANGTHPGFRRNHSKGVCVAGYFEGNNEAAALSKAVVFRRERTPVTGRFALAGGVPDAVDVGDAVLSFALSFALSDGEEWRTGMNDIPVFPFATPKAFYDQLIASAPDPATGKPDPAALKAFLAANPETVSALARIKARAIPSGFATATYNSLDAFLFVDKDGKTRAVRWSMVPMQPFVPGEARQSEADKNFLFDALAARIGHQPLQWHLVITVGRPGDVTNDATIAWEKNAGKLDVGTLTIDHIEGEDSGACRAINFDPLVLPSGIVPSDDPLLSARSAVYSRSVIRRDGELKAPSAVNIPTSTTEGAQ